MVNQENDLQQMRQFAFASREREGGKLVLTIKL